MRNNNTLFDSIMYLKITEKLIFDSKRIFEKKKDGDKRKGYHSIITGTGTRYWYLWYPMRPPPPPPGEGIPFRQVSFGYTRDFVWRIT